MQQFPFADDMSLLGTSLVSPFKDIFLLKEGGAYLRPVYGIFRYITTHIFVFNMAGYFYLNVGIHVLISIVVYTSAKKITKYQWVGFAFSLLYAFSSFALYQVIEVLGLMELICLLLATLMLSSLYDLAIISSDSIIKTSTLVVIYYLLIIYTHERFIVLVLPVCMMFFLQRRKYTKSWLSYLFCLLTISIFLSNILIKKFGMRTALLRGTSGQAIDFSTASPIRYALYHIGYIFGIHPSEFPQFDGISGDLVSPFIKTVILISGVSIVYIVILYLWRYFHDGKSETSQREIFCFIIVAMTAMACMIASSSFTIRVEQRWVYAPYVSALFILMAMYKAVMENRSHDSKKRTVIVLIVFLITNLAYSGYYRNHWEYVHFVAWNEIGETFHNEYLVKYQPYLLSHHIIYLNYNGAAISKAYHAPVLGDKWVDMDFTMINSLNDIEHDIDEDSSIVIKYDSEANNYPMFELDKIGNTIRTGMPGDSFFSWENDGEYIVMENTAHAMLRSGEDGIVNIRGTIPALVYPHKLTLEFDGEVLGAVEIGSKEFNVEMEGIPPNKLGVLQIKFEYIGKDGQNGVVHIYDIDMW